MHCIVIIFISIITFFSIQDPSVKHFRVKLASWINIIITKCYTWIEHILLIYVKCKPWKLVYLVKSFLRINKLQWKCCVYQGQTFNVLSKPKYFTIWKVCLESRSYLLKSVNCLCKLHYFLFLFIRNCNENTFKASHTHTHTHTHTHKYATKIFSSSRDAVLLLFYSSSLWWKAIKVDVLRVIW